MKAPVYNLTGTKIKDIILDKEIFAAKVNEDLMTQAIRVHRGNQRQANAKTLTRSQINRTTKKIYRQKGTGGARHGSRKAPIYVGGGIAHGPRGNQNYSLDLTKKMKIAALKSALSQKATNNNIMIIQGLDKVKEPKTQKFASFLQKAIQNPRKVSIILDADMQNAKKSIANLPYASAIESSTLNTYQVINTNTLILTEESLKTLKQRLAK
jgi:large subunit ribosomal protein L4